MDLFNPAVVRAAWQQRNRILQRPKFAQFLKILPENLTERKGNDDFNDLWDTMEAEFI